MKNAYTTNLYLLKSIKFYHLYAFTKSYTVVW